MHIQHKVMSGTGDTEAFLKQLSPAQEARISTLIEAISTEFAQSWVTGFRDRYLDQGFQDAQEKYKATLARQALEKKDIEHKVATQETSPDSLLQGILEALKDAQKDTALYKLTLPLIQDVQSIVTIDPASLKPEFLARYVSNATSAILERVLQAETNSYPPSPTEQLQARVQRELNTEQNADIQAASEMICEDSSREIMDAVTGEFNATLCPIIMQDLQVQVLGRLTEILKWPASQETLKLALS